MRKSIEWLCYGGAQENIGKDDIGNIQVAVPPSDEQHAIAVFLDRETERIDSLIAKKQRQIELLNEKRSALISRAVTKGLNPDARMKDSGIEWLGEIPEHWDVHLLKRVAGITYGVSGELDRTLTEGIHILSLPNIGIDGNLHLEDVPFVQVEEGQEQSILLLHGDLLFNWRNGSSAHLGKTAYFDLEGKYTHVSFLLRIRFPLDKHEPRYFHRLLNGLRVTGFFSSSKAGVNNTFNQSELENLWIIIPPLDEQIAIADFLDREIRTIDALADCVENSIITLHEYRTALITATVTGKIDVRQEASHARTTH
jgi:restriction endonuclease S subunit